MKLFPEQIMTPGKDGTFDRAEIWQLTSSLRWNGAVLEQAWLSTKDGRIDWLPVPIVGPLAL